MNQYARPYHLHLNTNQDTYHIRPTKYFNIHIHILSFGIVTTFFVVPPYQTSFLT